MRQAEGGILIPVRRACKCYQNTTVLFGYSCLWLQEGGRCEHAIGSNGAVQAWREDCPSPKLHVILAIRAANHDLETTVTAPSYTQHGVSLTHRLSAERGDSPYQHTWSCDHQRAGMDMIHPSLFPNDQVLNNCSFGSSTTSSLHQRQKMRKTRHD